MEVSSVQQRTPTKRSKSPKKKKKKNNPIKVVYISNPMKVKTSASEFRALVQQLTGQDAELPPNPSRFQHPNDGDGDGVGVCGGHKTIGDGHESGHTIVMPPQIVDPNNKCEGKIVPGGVSSILEGFEPFDEAFTPQMIDNISALLPASVFYECAQVDQVLMQCNYFHQ